MYALRMNRLRLETLRHLPVSKVSAVRAQRLAPLQTDVREAMDRADFKSAGAVRAGRATYRVVIVSEKALHDNLFGSVIIPTGGGR